jgi:hypothetical protein
MDTTSDAARKGTDLDVRPIFIIGAPRSGTSITTWALGQHPNIQPMPETAWIASLSVGAFLAHRRGSERGTFSHLSNVDFPVAPFMARIGEAVDAIVHDAFAERCQRLYGDQPGQHPDWVLTEQQAANPMQLRRSARDPKRRWIDGTPLNSFYAWALAQMFPHARFIHNLRRPDEVATSLEGFDKVGAEPQALEHGLETWVRHTDAAWLAERAFGTERAFRLDFARLAGDPERLFAELCAFLGEAFSPDCLLPLQRRLNSSEVDDKREHNLALLRGIDGFKHAEAVYDLVVGQPGGASPEAEAERVLEQRFLDHCRDRANV